LNFAGNEITMRNEEDAGSTAGGPESCAEKKRNEKVGAMEICSVYKDCEEEALRYKWIESEKAGRDLGEAAVRRWVQNHWWGYLRARWLEHLQGKRFWVELDRGDFGLLQRRFHDNTLLLDRILDRLKSGQENLDIIIWAQDWGLPIPPVLEILEALDINSRRLAHRFDP
jgi:hypothetical protein